MKVKVFSLITGVLLGLAVSITPVNTEAETPTLGLYFENDLMSYIPGGAFDYFDAYLYIDADYYITGVEYQLTTPEDPGHYKFSYTRVSYPSEYKLSMGSPFDGHSIVFWPPLKGFFGPQIICTLEDCYITEECPQMIDFPIVIGSHPNTGDLAGTYYPDYELFDITGLTSFLCPFISYPVIEDVTVLTPRCIRVSFGACISKRNQITVYPAGSPEDSIPVAASTIDSVYFQGSCPDYSLQAGSEFLVYLDSSLSEGTQYQIEADVCGGGYLYCGPSSYEFDYQNSFSPGADLTVSCLIDYKLGYSIYPFCNIYLNKFGNHCSPYDIEYQVINAGDQYAGTFSVRMAIEDKFDPSHNVTVHTETYPGLGSGEMLWDTVTVMLPQDIWSLNELAVEVDYLDQVSEWTELNNELGTVFYCHWPWIVSISDVPADYGGWIELTYHCSRDEMCKTYDSHYYFIERLDRDTQNWEVIEQVEATGDTLYTLAVPTQVDSGEVEDYMTSFRVVWDDGSSSYYSCADSGYSVNNKGVAVMLEESSVHYENSGIVLWWKLISDQELEYIISRSRGREDFLVMSVVEIKADGQTFRVMDTDVEPGGEYRYRVEYMESGNRHLLFQSEVVSVPKLSLTLSQNYPNPFNPSTVIPFYLPERGRVVLEVFDVSGHRVRTLVDGDRSGGWHNEKWDGLDGSGSPVSSGIYFYQLKSGKKELSRKMLLMR
jgi:hypothetical protein